MPPPPRPRSAVSPPSSQSEEQSERLTSAHHNAATLRLEPASSAACDEQRALRRPPSARINPVPAGPVFAEEPRSRSRQQEQHKEDDQDHARATRPASTRSIRSPEDAAEVQQRVYLGIEGLVPTSLPTKQEREEEEAPLAGPGPCTEGDRELCGKYLDRVSRSFAVVIRQLPPPLALPVCAFYLVLRALVRCPSSL